MKKLTEISKAAGALSRAMLMFGVAASSFVAPAINAAGLSAPPKITVAAVLPAEVLSDPLLSVDMNRTQIVSQLVKRWQGEIANSKVANFKAEAGGLRADQLLSAAAATRFDDVLDILDSQVKSSPRLGALTSLQGGSLAKSVGDANADLAYTPLTPCRLLDTRTGQTSALGQLGGTFTPNTVRNIVPAGVCGIPAAGVKNLFVGFTTINNTPNSGGFLSLLGPGAPLTTSNDIFNIGAQLSSGSGTVPTGTAGQFDIFVATANSHVVIDVLGYFASPTSGNIANSIAGGNVFTVTNTNTAGFSTALRGISTSTTGGGIGVYGSHAGSGFGVFGVAGTNGYGVRGQAPAGGYGVYSVGDLGVSTNGVLDFGSQTRQMIQLWGGVNKYGIGVQAGTQYFRTDASALSGGLGGFAWFEGGEHSDNALDAGAGGTVMMKLERGPSLQFPTVSPTDQQITFRGIGQGVGGQNSTAYMRTNSNIAFFLNGVHTNNITDPGTGGSVLATIQTGAGSVAVTGNVRALGFTATSDRASKTDFASVNAKSILAKVASLPISTWKYIAEQGSGVRHIGPVAQDFMKAFNVGYDDKSISSIDASGVALTAIKGLSEIVQEKDARISSLEKELAAIKKKLGM
jgi:Chaperone of endosialidase